MNKMLSSLPPTGNMLYRHILRSCYVVLIIYFRSDIGTRHQFESCGI